MFWERTHQWLWPTGTCLSGYSQHIHRDLNIYMRKELLWWSRSVSVYPHLRADWSGSTWSSMCLSISCWTSFSKLLMDGLWDNGPRLEETHCLFAVVLCLFLLVLCLIVDPFPPFTVQPPLTVCERAWFTVFTSFRHLRHLCQQSGRHPGPACWCVRWQCHR